MSKRGVVIGDSEDDIDASVTSSDDTWGSSLPSMKKKQLPLQKSGSKEFKGLVALINHSSKIKTGPNASDRAIEGVLKRWTALSKY